MLHEQSLLTIRETADLLKVHRRTLERWEATGRLIPLRLSTGVIRYRSEDVDQFLRASDPLRLPPGPDDDGWPEPSAGQP